jgi:1-pyrroline-5-carboxylate dehydrogenase
VRGHGARDDGAGVENRLVYRPLEGFVAAITPFNFLAIGANLNAAPALMGNVTLWKPADTAMYGVRAQPPPPSPPQSYLIMKVFEEAGLPPGVVQFVPIRPPNVASKIMIAHPDFAGLHFTVCYLAF